MNAAPRTTGEREFLRFLAAGEGETVEFKRCSNGVRDDTFETVCSFANGAGGDIFLGVEDGGTVRGLAADAARKIADDIVRAAANPTLFKPAMALETAPETEIFRVGRKTLVRVRVAGGGGSGGGSGVAYAYKGVVYKRVGDADLAR